MTHFFNARNFAFAFTVAVYTCIFAPAMAQDAGQQQPGASDPAQGDSAVFPLQPVTNSHVQQPQAVTKPIPAGLPTTEKSGDDLIVHSPGGDYTIPGFMKTVGPGMAGNVNVGVPGHGNCDLKVDSSGATVDAKCDQ